MKKFTWLLVLALLVVSGLAQAASFKNTFFPVISGGSLSAASDAQAQNQTSTGVYLTPGNLAAIGANSTLPGLVQFSTPTEAIGQDNSTVLTPYTGMLAANATINSRGLLPSTLITNAEFKVASRSDSYTNSTIPTQVNASVISSGVVDCAASQVHSLAVGDLIHWDVSPYLGTGNTFNVVTSVTNSTRFTIDNTSITNATAQDAWRVMRGFTGADTYCFDYWFKQSGMAVYQDNTTVNDGGPYSMKVVGDGASGQVSWSPSGANWTMPFNIARFKGRTVTFGCWVKTSAASKARLNIYDGAQTFSSYHTGGGGWEWLEVTHTCSTGTGFFVSCDAGTSNTAYFQKPMLAFSSSLGSGNFVPRQHEQIWLESPLTTQTIVKTGYSTLALTKHIVAESAGMIGAGAESFMADIANNDSASAASTSVGVFLGSDSSTLYGRVACGGLTNDVPVYGTTESGIASDDTFVVYPSASGSGTLDIGQFNIISVVLR